jgi:hypothetical protein
MPQLEASQAGKGLADAERAANEVLEMAQQRVAQEMRRLAPPEPEPEPELRQQAAAGQAQAAEEAAFRRQEELHIAREKERAGALLKSLELAPRMCQFGQCGNGIRYQEPPSEVRRSAQCEHGPSCLVSMQMAVDTMLAWTVRVCGVDKHPRIIIGAVPNEFLSDLDRAPTDPRWVVSSAAGAASDTKMIRVKPGDRFAVVADLKTFRLTVHQQHTLLPEQPARSGQTQEQPQQQPAWECVLDTTTLQGAVRLCVCLFADAEVELLKMRWSGAADNLQQRYEKALALLEPALGPADPTVLSTQHNLATIHLARAEATAPALAPPGEPHPTFRTAEQLMGLALSGRTVVLGAEHPHTRKSAACLALIQRRSWAAQLEAIYSVHNPRKIRDIEALLDQHVGSEPALLRLVRQKYQIATVAEKEAVARAEVEQQEQQETEVLADRFLGAISDREDAARASKKKEAEELLAFERAAEEAAVAAKERLEQRMLRGKERALRKEVEAGRPPVEQRKQARDALAAAAALLGGDGSPGGVLPPVGSQFSSPDRVGGACAGAMPSMDTSPLQPQGQKLFLSPPPPPPLLLPAGSPQQALGAGGVGTVPVSVEQAAAVEQMRAWALEVERNAPRVHGSRTMYM